MVVTYTLYSSYCSVCLKDITFILWQLSKQVNLSTSVRRFR